MWHNGAAGCDRSVIFAVRWLPTSPMRTFTDVLRKRHPEQHHPHAPDASSCLATSYKPSMICQSIIIEPYNDNDKTRKSPQLAPGTSAVPRQNL